MEKKVGAGGAKNGNGESPIVVERNGKVCMDGFKKINDEKNWLESGG